jgi:integrase
LGLFSFAAKSAPSDAKMMLTTKGAPMAEYSDLKYTTQKNGNLKGYMYYRDAAGKRRQITFTSKKKGVREAKKEIREWAEGIRQQGQTDVSLGQGRRKILETVVEEYLDKQLSVGAIEKSTYCKQKGCCKNSVYPYIGGITFTELNKDAIENWITDLYAAGYKQSSVRMAYTIVAKVYRYWFKQGAISRNPFDYVDKPRRPAPKKTYLTQEQLDRLFDCLNGAGTVDVKPHLYVAVELGILSGMRRGEVCGLRWYDVNFNENTITVSTAIGVGYSAYAKGPKNESSYRTFPIVPQLREVLKAEYRRQQEKWGEVQSGWFVCGNRNKYLAPATLDKEFREFCQENELVDYYGKRLTFHSLRHNFATFGVRANVDIASLSRMLGHKSKALTLDVYADASPTAMKSARDRMAESWVSQTDYLTYTGDATQGEDND